MTPEQIIAEIYDPGGIAFDILVRHGRAVAAKAAALAAALRESTIPDPDFLREAAMLHDIGICFTRSPGLGCLGTKPYVCHGVLGRDLLERRGLPRHALVCERHVGVGITVAEIRKQRLPLPERDMRPRSIEEEIICYADKFFSKTGKKAHREKTMAEIRTGLAHFGATVLQRFDAMAERFGNPPAEGSAA